MYDSDKVRTLIKGSIKEERIINSQARNRRITSCKCHIVFMRETNFADNIAYDTSVVGTRLTTAANREISSNHYEAS